MPGLLLLLLIGFSGLVGRSDWYSSWPDVKFFWDAFCIVYLGDLDDAVQYQLSQPVRSGPPASLAQVPDSRPGQPPWNCAFWTVG